MAAPACLLGALAIGAGLPATVSAGLLLAAQVMLSGAMHEDGLADSADGLWGAMTRERRLEIMRDSRIGSYGVLALILSVGLRWSALGRADLGGGLGGGTGGGGAVARGDAGADGRPAPRPHRRAVPWRRPTRGSGAVWGAMALALGLALACAGWAALSAAVWAALAVAGMGALARTKLGGQTGDILGAAQQLAEIAALLALLAGVDRRLIRPRRRDVQDVTAMLAMHGVGIVPQQPAFGAPEPHLLRLEQGAHQLQEQRHAEHHHEDREQLARRACAG